METIPIINEIGTNQATETEVIPFYGMLGMQIYK
jgi:hypothetical protein